MADRIFLREVKLEKLNKSLLFYQSSVGNVSCVVWDAALVLTKYIEKRSKKTENWLSRVNVIELGAGLGCVGVAAACFGARVVLTDQPEVVPQLVKTIELNRTAFSTVPGAKLTAVPYTWGSTTTAPVFDGFGSPVPTAVDLILISDCVYYQDAVEPLLTSIKLLSDSKTEILLCQEKRDTPKQEELWKSFISSFQDGFTARKIPPGEQDETYVSPDILLYSATKKT